MAQSMIVCLVKAVDMIAEKNQSTYPTYSSHEHFPHLVNNTTDSAVLPLFALGLSDHHPSVRVWHMGTDSATYTRL